MPYAARSILAIDLSPFGQSLALLPAMRALRTSYPKTFLVSAAPAGTCQLLAASGFVDETIDLGVVKLPSRGNAGALRRFLTLIRHSRRYSFDLVLDFSPRLETQIVSRLILRARTLSPSKLPRALDSLLGLGGLGRSSANVASSDYSNVLEQIGVEMGDQHLGITLPAEEDARFERRLATSGSRGGELIVLLYGSNHASPHGWPLASFGEIAIRLVNNFAARIIVADEPTDHTFTTAVGPLLPGGSIKLIEPHALELVAAIARASIVITDEPAIASIAAELSTPVIEIADTMSPATVSSRTHRIAKGSSRRRVSTDDVYDTTCEVIQEGRSPSLFQRP
jgi:ADP-heptose:LPS heptosyltransferase